MCGKWLNQHFSTKCQDIESLIMFVSGQISSMWIVSIQNVYVNESACDFKSSQLSSKFTIGFQIVIISLNVYHPKESINLAVTHSTFSKYQYICYYDISWNSLVNEMIWTEILLIRVACNESKNWTQGVVNIKGFAIMLFFVKYTSFYVLFISWYLQFQYYILSLYSKSNNTPMPEMIPNMAIIVSMFLS